MTALLIISCAVAQQMRTLVSRTACKSQKFRRHPEEKKKLCHGLPKRMFWQRLKMMICSFFPFQALITLRATFLREAAADQYSAVQYSTVQCSMAGGKYFTLPLQRKTLTNLSRCDRGLLGPSHDNVHMRRVNHQSGMSKPHDRRTQLMH